MDAFTFREAVPADTTAIIEFQIAMAQETEQLALDAATCTSGVNAVFTRPELGRYFVAENQGKEIVGSLLITYEWSDWRNGMIWWIQSVYVVPSGRQRGVYRGLYEHVAAIVRNDPSLRGIRLYVDRTNQNAQKVYARLGMNGEHYQVFEWMK